MTLRQACSVMVAATLLLTGCTNDREADGPEAPHTTANPDAPPPASGSGIVTGAIPVSGGVRAYVVLTPESSVAVPPPSTKPVLDQVQMTFVPNLLFARAGYAVEFRSSDEELHNVNVKRSRTFDPEFNVAIPPGGTFEHTFKSPGFYDVNCDIHPAMSAQILVTATPHVAMAEPDGSFRFSDVEPGPYTLTVHSGIQRAEQQIRVAPGQNLVEVAFDRWQG